MRSKEKYSDGRGDRGESSDSRKDRTSDKRDRKEERDKSSRREVDSRREHREESVRRSESRANSERDKKEPLEINTANKTKKEEAAVASQKIFVDDMGRVVDEKGNIIPKANSISTLKININKNKEQKVKELLRIQRIDQSQLRSKKDHKFYDPLLDQIKKKKEKKKANAFVFIEKGTFVRNRKEQTAKLLGIDLNKTQLTEEEENDLLNPELLPYSSKKQSIKLKAHDLIPEVEWWDSYFLPPGRKTFSPYVEKDEAGNFVKKEVKEIKFEDFVVEDFAKEKVTHFVQHPVPIKNDYIEKMNKVALPMFLTKKERKRLRKLRRQEKEKDKQEKLKLGLIEPDKPKLKFNNFMRIMSEEAIQDPSKVEREVRKAYEERYSKMMAENEARKLTKDQKHEKIRRKFERDIKKECRACLFKIENLPDKRIKFKIDKNAQQLYLTGICIYAHKSIAGSLPNLLLVEGGPLAIKKYKNLILRRIKWQSQRKENPANPDGQIPDPAKKDEPMPDPKCSIVWEGVVKKRYFEKWKTVDIRTENEARKLLADKGIEHFWNLILSYKDEGEVKV